MTVQTKREHPWEIDHRDFGNVDWRHKIKGEQIVIDCALKIVTIEN